LGPAADEFAWRRSLRGSDPFFALLTLEGLGKPEAFLASLPALPRVSDGNKVSPALGAKGEADPTKEGVSPRGGEAKEALPGRSSRESEQHSHGRNDPEGSDHEGDARKLGEVPLPVAGCFVVNPLSPHLYKMGPYLLAPATCFWFFLPRVDTHPFLHRTATGGAGGLFHQSTGF
jgi:hypothetical protein